MARVRECILETDKIQSQQNVLHHRAIIFLHLSHSSYSCSGEVFKALIIVLRPIGLQVQRGLHKLPVIWGTLQ